ncbi:MAG: FliM/FliN family flagellar motor switch protein, partial [Alphaproteobacteria bacterium]|nr:FliM/FliN family flagellar motor switch protein [Alphaproteobacteria bacterium]
SLGDIIDWKPGTILPLSVEPSSKVIVRAGDVDVFEGKMGKHGEKVAIKMQDRIYDPENYLRKPLEFF